MKRNRQIKTLLSRTFLKSICFLLIILSIFSSVALAQDTGPIDEVRDLIRYFYVKPVSEEILNLPSIEEIIKALEDPYSEYLTESEYESFINGINNSIVGIGIVTEMLPEGVLVISVFPDSPAMESGLQPGDIITKANGVPLAGKKQQEAISYIRGDEGTVVELEVLRESKYFHISAERRKIEIPTVEGRMLKGNIAYIPIISFGEKTPDEFEKVFASLEEQDPRAYIIDLMNNTGGMTQSVYELAGYFIGDNVVTKMSDDFGREVGFKAVAKNFLINKPVVLLVNKYSASASEILAAGLKDYDKAFLIGTNTFGKGKAQTIFLLSDGSYLKLTTWYFTSPFGRKIDDLGVSPDLDAGPFDPLQLAFLLLGEGPKTVDSRGYVRLYLDGRYFTVDLEEASKDENWEAYWHLLGKAAQRGRIEIGTASGWRSLTGDFKEKAWRMIFPEYEELSPIDQAPVDKKFTLSFTTDTNQETVNKDSVELIKVDTGERVPLNFSFDDAKKVVISPETLLEPGENYYLVIHDTIRGAKGQRLVKGAVAKVHVK